MFMHATEEGWKEVERFIHWGHWHALPWLNPEVDVPTVQIVGYQTSWKEIWDLYQKVYLLQRLPGPLPCGPDQMEEAIQDILSSLRSHLQRQEGTVMLEEGKRRATMAALWPSHQTRSCSWSQGRNYQHNEALWEVREAHWQVLDAAHVLEVNIDSWAKKQTAFNANTPQLQLPLG